MNPRRLYRSRDRQLAGVAGGMAEYLDVDPTIIRIGWILVTLVTGGLALIGYLLLALVIPQSPYPAGTAYGAGPWTGQPTGAAWPGQAQYGAQPLPGAGQTWSVPPTTAAPQWNPAYVGAVQAPASRGLGAAGIIGILLVVIGGIALADIALPGLRIGLALGPAVILALGIGLLLSSVRRQSEPVAPSTPAAAYSAPTPTSGPAPVGADAAGTWSAVPSDMTPWPATQPAAPAPSSALDQARPGPMTGADTDATQTDLPAVSKPGSIGPTGERA